MHTQQKKKKKKKVLTFLAPGTSGIIVVEIRFFLFLWLKFDFKDV